METLELNSYLEIKEFCLKINVRNTLNNYTTLYRGTKTDYINPSILGDHSYDFDELSEREEVIFQEFYVRYNDTIKENDQTLKEWRIRVKGREHGLDSRLIDWTHDLVVSLDFSTFTYPSDTITDGYTYLWVLSLESEFTKELNDLRTLPFSKINESFVFNGIHDYGSIHTRRQLIQGVHFLVQPSNFISTRINDQRFFSDRLIKIKIPVENLNTIREDLSRIKNLNQSLMIEKSPIDKFCHSLNQKHLSK